MNPHAEHPWDPRRIAYSYLYTVGFCAAIVALLQALGAGGTLLQSSQVSFSIGLSIHTAFILLMRPLSAMIGARLAPIPITALGLAIGLVLGAWLAIGEPLFFFQGRGYGTLVFGIFFGVLGFLFFTTRDSLTDARAALAEAKADIAEQEKQQAETELRLLQAQIEPHFLFNTLSNVISLIRSDPERAEHTLLHLTQFLRSTLKRSRQSDGCLGDELAIIRAYLEIQQTRMGARLRFEIDVPRELEGAPFPPLLLQPLVENAVIHGIEPAESGGTVRVSARREEDRIALNVADDGVGIGTNVGKGSGSHLGLRNTRARLQSLYGGAASLSLCDKPPHGVQARILVPSAPA